MSALWVEAGGFIHAPVTVGTNLLIAGQCAVLSGRFRRSSRPDVSNEWRRFFQFMALAAVLGAVKHSLPPQSRGWIWLGAVFLSNAAGGVATAFAQMATVRAWVGSRNARRRWKWAIVGQLLGLCVTTVLRPGFGPALVNTIVGLTPVLVVETLNSTRGRLDGKGIAAGFALTGLAGALYALRIHAGSWLSPVDVAHLVMVASLAVIYRGVLRRVRSVPPIPVVLAASRLTAREGGTRHG